MNKHALTNNNITIFKMEDLKKGRKKEKNLNC